MSFMPEPESPDVLKVKDVMLVWSKTLREFAEPRLGRSWDLHEGEDCPAQNTSISVTVPDEDLFEDDEYEEVDFQRWLDGGEYSLKYSMEPDCRRVMNWLYKEHHISAGEYVVDVWW